MIIRPSLKMYLLMMMITAGIATISFMSVVSYKYFFMGVDFAMYASMREQAEHQIVTQGNPTYINGFVVASRWQDLPDVIQTKLNEQDLEPGELLKLMDGIPFFRKPKSGYFAIKINDNGQIKFVSKILAETAPHSGANKKPPKSNNIIWIALIAIILFSLVPYLFLRRVTVPIERLVKWTKQLHDKKQLAQKTPDFHYSELNNLAGLVHSSQQSLQQSLQREQRFLGYASHELRTPIAVTRTNTELLRKMIAKSINIEKQQQVVDRIERACLTMTDLTETLLWLNRQPDRSLPIQSLSIGQLTQQLLMDLNYLTIGKSINININIDHNAYPLPEALCRIIITNLIRNALQHTQQGNITIAQSHTHLMISNQNTTHPNGLNDALSDSQELGFGLGLELTQRLVEHYGWQYTNTANNSGHHVEIDFIASPYDP